MRPNDLGRIRASARDRWRCNHGMMVTGLIWNRDRLFIWEPWEVPMAPDGRRARVLRSTQGGWVGCSVPKAGGAPHAIR